MKRKKNIRTGLLLLCMMLFLVAFAGGCAQQKEETKTYYTKFSELENKRIGVTTGSIQAIQAQERFPNAQFFYFSNHTDMLNALRAGKIDAFADASALVQYMLPDTPDLTIMDEWLVGGMKVGAIFSKTEQGKALCDEYSAFIREIKENGVYDEIMDIWFGADEEKKVVPDPESIKGSRGVLHVAADPTMVPYVFVKDGQYAGFDMDTVVRFCKEHDYGLEISPMEFSGIIPAVSTGKCDLACGGVAYTEERAESVYFSEPTYEGGSVVAVLKDPAKGASIPLSELKKPGMRIAVLTGSELYNVALETFPDCEVLAYDTFADVFQSVHSGKADAALGFPNLETDMKEAYPDIVKIPDAVTEFDYGFATQKNKKGQKLKEELDEWFRKLKDSGKSDELYEKWEKSEGKQVMEDYRYDGKNGTLKLATVGTWSPMTFYYGNELTGYFVELINGFCAEYGYTPQWETTPYVSEITGLSTGEYDIVADTVVRTPERMEEINVTEPIFHQKVYAFAPEVKSAASGTGGFFESLKDSFVKTFIREDRWKMIVSGLGVTLALSALSAVFGTILGGLICFLRTRKNKVAVGFANVYIRIFRGIPIVVLLLVLNYLIFTGAEFPAFWVCAIGFSLDFSAYTSEMFRNGIEAVPEGQSKAAKAMGFGGFHGFRKIIFPQALLHILPVYTGQFIALVKLTSVAGYISVMDLTRAADIIRSRTFDAFFPLIITAVIYFLLSVVLIALLRKLEKKIQPGTRRILKVQKLMEARKAGKLSPFVHKSPVSNDESESRPVLYQVSHLKKEYETATPIRDLNCEIRRGDAISIIGPSGTGKSTFLYTLNQLETVSGGEILFKGENILEKGYDLKALREKVGMVFQAFYLFSHLTIVENIMLAQEELLNRTKEDAFQYSMEVLEKVGLADKAMNYPAELSGGQQQRVAIAREVAMDPEMILFDEPTSALDPTTIGEVLAVIRQLARHGMTMVIVTHEMKFAKDVSTRVFYLDEGGVYEEGSPDQIFLAPQKEKTRQFIEHLKVLKLKIEGTAFDYAGAVTETETFGFRHLIEFDAIRRMVLLTEELGVAILQNHYREKTDAEFTFEYQEETGKLSVKVIFAGDDFDPLTEGDAISVALIRNIVSDLTFRTEEGKGIMEGRIEIKK